MSGLNETLARCIHSIPIKFGCWTCGIPTTESPITSNGNLPYDYSESIKSLDRACSEMRDKIGQLEKKMVWIDGHQLGEKNLFNRVQDLEDQCVKHTGWQVEMEHKLPTRMEMMYANFQELLKINIENVYENMKKNTKENVIKCPNCSHEIFMESN